MHLLVLMFLGILCGCRSASGDDGCPTGSTAPACLGLGTEDPTSLGTGEVNLDGAPLALCSQAPLTGYYRDGRCRTGSDDRGVHVVCAEMTTDFLSYTSQQGNDLSTPRPGLGFPGLQPGDRWCLCAARWEEARQAGVAPPVILPATHPAALRASTDAALREHAHPSSQ